MSISAPEGFIFYNPDTKEKRVKVYFYPDDEEK